MSFSTEGLDVPSPSTVSLNSRKSLSVISIAVDMMSNRFVLDMKVSAVDAASYTSNQNKESKRSDDLFNRSIFVEVLESDCIISLSK